MALGVTVAESVVTSADIEIIRERYKTVKKERARRLEEWKTEINKAIGAGEKERQRFLKRKEKLLAKDPLEPKDQKELAQINEKLYFLEKGRLDDKAIDEKSKKLLDDILYQEGAYTCPFCGRKCGSASGVNEHLKLTGNQELKDLRKLESMDSIAQNMPNIQKIAENEASLKEKLGKIPFAYKSFSLPNGAVGLPFSISKDMLTSVSKQVFSFGMNACTKRLERALKIEGLDIIGKGISLALPSIDINKFKALNGMNFSSLLNSQKQQVADFIMKQTGMQLHIPGGGKNSYELLLQKGIAKFEKEMFVSALNRDGIPEIRKKVAGLLKENIQKTVDTITKDLNMKGPGKFFVSEAAHSATKLIKF